MKKIKKLIHKLQKSGGYVSVETVVIGGLLLSLGAFIFTEFFFNAREIVAMGADKVYMSADISIYDHLEPIP